MHLAGGPLNGFKGENGKGNKAAGISSFRQHHLWGEFGGGGRFFPWFGTCSAFSSFCRSARLTLLPAEGAVRKPAGGPQLHVSAATAAA